MWIFTKDGFLSVVAHEQDESVLRVRARRREHLAALVPLRDVIDMGDAADYRWHADVPRDVVIDFATKAIDGLDYTSHVKEAISGRDDRMYRAMMECWTALLRLQDQPKRSGMRVLTRRGAFVNPERLPAWGDEYDPDEFRPAGNGFMWIPPEDRAVIRFPAQGAPKRKRKKGKK
jgi:hypothetical protein